MSGSVHQADVGAARHGELGHAARRRLLRRSLGAALPPPVPGAGVARPGPRLGGSGALAAPPDPDFQFGRWLVTA